MHQQMLTAFRKNAIGVGSLYNLLTILSPQFITEYILLYHAPEPFIPAVGEASFIMGIKSLADMGIHRKSVQVMPCKKADAVCHLLSDAKQL